ncbi:hypothetical protein HID58_037484 [Brassica napus]|uniref:Secreted protein n=1 Tax=Brassica napus TaxID=3708 RepID=A0ABQ8BLI2_BRANA|nr:hypothetical protein HID58_037484 [Brassica napus]
MLRSLSLLVELKSVLTPLTEVLTNLLVVRRLLARAKAGAQTVTLLTQRMVGLSTETNNTNPITEIGTITDRHGNREEPTRRTPSLKIRTHVDILIRMILEVA